MELLKTSRSVEFCGVSSGDKPICTSPRPVPAASGVRLLWMCFRLGIGGRDIGAAQEWVPPAIAGCWRRPVLTLTSGHRYGYSDHMPARPRSDRPDHAGVPFVQDGLRDGEHLRAWMTEEFRARPDETGRKWALLTGIVEGVARALAYCDALLRAGRVFAEPLG